MGDTRICTSILPTPRLDRVSQAGRAFRKRGRLSFKGDLPAASARCEIGDLPRRVPAGQACHAAAGVRAGAAVVQPVDGTPVSGVSHDGCPVGPHLVRGHRADCRPGVSVSTTGLGAKRSGEYARRRHSGACPSPGRGRGAPGAHHLHDRDCDTWRSRVASMGNVHADSYAWRPPESSALRGGNKIEVEVLRRGIGGNRATSARQIG